MKKVLVLAVLMILVAKPTSAFYGHKYDVVYFGWGASYRIQDNFYYQFTAGYEQVDQSCTYRSFRHIGISYIAFSKSNYSISLQYCSAIKKLAMHAVIPYWGISPSCFLFEGKSGYNAKPQVGLKVSPVYGYAFGIDIDFAYGYDIPITSTAEFNAGRHEVSTIICLTINLFEIGSLVKTNEESVNARF